MVELGLKALLLTVIAGHICAYKHHYVRIGLSFTGTYVLKRLAKVAGQTENSQLLGLGGYSITAGEFFILLQNMLKNGCTGNGKSIISYIFELSDKLNVPSIK